MNQISIRTNKGEYFGGETIYGTVYLWICSPTTAKDIKLKLKGYEKCEWEYTKLVSREGPDGTTEWDKEQCKVKGDKSFFKTEYKLVEYHDGIPIGHYAYPFQYTLPQEIPGTFRMKGKTSHSDDDNEWEANVKYRVKAAMEAHDGKKLKIAQPLVIRTDARTQINQSETHEKEGTVRMCFCIPRGNVKLLARLDSNVYEAGSTANVHVNVDNDSSVDIDNFVLKLMQVIHLRGKDEESDSERRVSLTNTVCESKYEGCESGSKKECDIELPLRSAHGEIEPTTKGGHVQCTYHIDIEMQVSWAPDIEIHAPITLTAPSNNWWQQWTAPQWLPNCQPVPVQGACAVPQPVMHSQTFSNVPCFGPPL